MDFLRRLFGRRPEVAPEGMTSGDVLRVVSAYGAVLSQPRSQVGDAAELPYPKPVIKQALISAIGLAQQSTMRDELRTAYVLLADWQDSGETPAESSARDAGSVLNLTERIAAETRALAEELRSLGLQQDAPGD